MAHTTRLWGAGVASILGVAGCGAPDGAPHAARQVSALLDNGDDLTLVSGAWPQTNYQSETSIVADDFSDGTHYMYVGFNAEDARPGHTSFVDVSVNGQTYEDRVICAGTTSMGYDIWNAFNDGWQGSLYVPLPDSTAVFYGDPTVAQFDGQAFLAGVASPSDYFSSRANYNGCFRVSNVPDSPYPASIQGALAGACVLSTLWGNTFGGQSECLHRQGGVDSPTGQDFLDGSGLAATDFFLYAAFFDVTTGTGVMYQRPASNTGLPTSFVAIEDPPFTGITDHVLLVTTPPGEDAPSLGAVYAITVSLGTLMIAKYSETSLTSGSWSPAVTVASDYSEGFARMKNGGPGIRNIGFAAAMLDNAGNPDVPRQIAIFYQRFVGGTFVTQLQGVLCDPNTLACTAPADMVTSSADNAFNPAITTAFKQVGGQTFPSAIDAVSYWTDHGLTDGSVQLAYSSFTRDGGPLIERVGLTQPQTPCPFTSQGYWGDYDFMGVLNNGGPLPTFVRPVTDSTAVACDTSGRANQDFRGTDQHVTAVLFPVP
jgi:hypothetical protein